MSSPLSFDNARYTNFDCLRLFLAAEVVAGHLWVGLYLPGELWVPIPPVAAFVGLSGFLIPQSLARSRDLWHFAWKRVLRTMPALIPLMLAIAIVLGRGPATGAITQYLTAGYRGEFLGVTLPLWSLIVEDALYACMALLFVCRAHDKYGATVLILAALLVGNMLVHDPVAEYRLFSTSIAFFTGHLVYIFQRTFRGIHWTWPAAGMTATLLSWLHFMGPLEFPFLIACVIVLAMVLPQFRWRLPDVSYGTYIWHGPIMMALLSRGAPRDWKWALSTILLTLMTALCSWYLVEKKALRLKDWRFRRAPNRPREVRKSAIASPVRSDPALGSMLAPASNERRLD
jgi:peptidoglycan/LPS O-acetylase OafA/YrhL